jgi:membrane protein YqaA with SNARE-associated domain
MMHQSWKIVFDILMVIFSCNFVAIFLGNWYSWIIELFVRAIRPFLDFGQKEKTIWLKSPWKPIVEFALVCGPLTLFGIYSQIETGKGVAENDFPRKAIVKIGWIEVVLSYIQNFLPLIPPESFGNEMFGKNLLLFANIGRDFLSTAVGVVRMNIEIFDVSTE